MNLETALEIASKQLSTLNIEGAKISTSVDSDAKGTERANVWVTYPTHYTGESQRFDSGARVMISNHHGHWSLNSLGWFPRGMHAVLMACEAAGFDRADV